MEWGRVHCLKKGKKEAKKGATKEEPGFAGCRVELQPGKRIEESLLLMDTQWLRRKRDSVSPKTSQGKAPCVSR